MSDTVNLNLHLSKEILSRAAEVAGRSDRLLEDVLAEWLARFIDNLPIETLSDDEVLWMCDFELNPVLHRELRELLIFHRERGLTTKESIRLDELLQFYRKGIVRKARATEVAIARGLRDRPA